MSDKYLGESRREVGLQCSAFNLVGSYLDFVSVISKLLRSLSSLTFKGRKIYLTQCKLECFI